jgi:hypothetical protein
MRISDLDVTDLMHLVTWREIGLVVVGFIDRGSEISR